MRSQLHPWGAPLSTNTALLPSREAVHSCPGGWAMDQTISMNSEVRLHEPVGAWTSARRGCMCGGCGHSAPCAPGHLCRELLQSTAVRAIDTANPLAVPSIVDDVRYRIASRILIQGQRNACSRGGNAHSSSSTCGGGQAACRSCLRRSGRRATGLQATPNLNHRHSAPSRVSMALDSVRKWVVMRGSGCVRQAATGPLLTGHHPLGACPSRSQDRGAVPLAGELRGAGRAASKEAGAHSDQAVRGGVGG